MRQSLANPAPFRQRLRRGDITPNQLTFHLAPGYNLRMYRNRSVEFLYEDRDIIAVDKPAGLAVIAGRGSREKTLYDFVSRHIERTNPHGRAALVHRLDRDTSGVMIFAKHAKAKKALMDNWNELVKERVYVALVEGRMAGDSGTYDSWLAENSAGTVWQTDPGAPGALRAITRWRLLSGDKYYSLVELSLETGRKHQIRAQLAADHHPVAGDQRYGARTDPAGRLCLHARLLVLEHPFLHKVFRFESEVPECFYRAAAQLQRTGKSRRHADF